MIAANQSELSQKEMERYSRQLSLPPIGIEGQRKLKRARVLVVGAGGLGSPALLYLASAGVGTIGLVDFDPVDVTNLHRQVLYTDADVGSSKTRAASERIAAANPHVHVEPYETRLTSSNALEIAADYDIIVDGTDNFATRYLVNDTAVLLGKTNVYASVLRFEGQASVFGAPDGPCYRCLFRDPPPAGLIPNCAEAGVLGALPGIMGSIQASETIKLITGAGAPLIGRLLLFDALAMTFRVMEVRRDPSCPMCGTREIRELVDYEAWCGNASEPVREEGEPEVGEITPVELSDRINRGDDIELLDVREPYEWAIARLPGARHIPLGALPGGMHQLDPDRETVVYCKSGMRSMAAATQLAAAGFKKVANLSGGILRWSAEVDSSVPRY
ncbi:MAG TPA: molybdopterin-synthase adenylyltransferase MoeB [Gemmatimonadaceae bacterium]|nr:molybdopterin-synthase adenylyltransferase MoeB [Gemmatimonadaceae bacterium]